MRGEAFARQLKLLALLEGRPEGVEPEEAAGELGTQRRTVYRDFRVLEDAGFPLTSAHDGRRARWRMLEGYRHRLQLTLTWSELVALMTARQMLSGLAGTMLHDGAASALEKIRVTLPKGLADHFRASERLVSAPHGGRDYGSRRELVRRLVEAIDGRQTIAARYRSRRTRGRNGTVDMIGSRMLFGGYGVSRRMRPYHAGMLGVDSLIVLDEAHLVPPFERLMEAIASGRDARGRLLGPEPDVDGVAPPLRLLPLSATGRARVGALELSDADRKHPVVKQRLAARKRVSLRAEVSPRDLAEALTREAWALAEAGAKPVRCIVYCNRRDDAAKVQAALQARRKQAGVERIDVGLLVGARRLFERQQAARWLEERGFFAGHRGPLACSTFVIATSAGEVGVDLDADHMVCDLVAWERMVQRLGRVNRRGEGDASIVVVAATAEDDESDRLVAVRALLDELPRFRKGELDASPGALTALRERARRKPALAELVVQASTPPDLHPPLSRPTVEAWSMTSIETHAGRPEAEPWIRGWHEEEAPQTAVAWRKHLPVTDRGRLIDKVALETFREGAPLKPAAARISDTSGCRLLEASSAVPGERWTGSSRASTREQPRGSSRRYAQRTSAHGGMTSGGLRGGGCGGATWPWCALPSIRIILRLMRPNRMSCHGMKVRKKRTAREGRGAKNSRE